MLVFLVGVGRTSPYLALLAVLAAGGVVAALVGRESGPEPSCGAAGGGACPDRAQSLPPPPPDASLSRAEACADAAYLCEGLAERGPLRVLRWDDATPEIRVLIPLPASEDLARARQLQEAAARGVRAWDRHPFPIRVTLRDQRDVEPDVTVRWSTTLLGTELGRARTRWIREGGRILLRVEDFSLATRNPFEPSQGLTLRQVELTAAHEMGHALGLPHSDEERDVMFPTNTAVAPTARDYRAMESLYRLANGAEIR